MRAPVYARSKMIRIPGGPSSQNLDRGIVALFPAKAWATRWCRLPRGCPPGLAVDQVTPWGTP